jgi:hypothetical protein
MQVHADGYWRRLAVVWFRRVHKGRDSGHAWSLLIDASAVVMSLISLSGLVLLLFFRRRRAAGLAVAIGGALLCYLIYQLRVP